MASNKTIEPGLWLMFSAGGVMAALFLPVLLLLFGLLIPLHGAAPSAEYLRAVIAHPISKVVLFIVCLLALFHAAHRFRFTLYDGLQIKHLNELIALLCYGGALAGSVAAGYVLFTL
jgi:fumarate reductase subunit D